MTHTTATIPLAALMLASCAGENARYRDIPPEGWPYGQTVDFAPGIPGDSARGTLEVFVRHDDDYPYANLWLEIDDGRRRDTVALRLADRYGHWSGTGVGSSLRFAAPPRAVTLRRGDTLRLRHLMRVDTLCGIRRVGLRFTPR